MTPQSRIYIFHAPGASDLGVGRADDGGREAVASRQAAVTARLQEATEPAAVTELLRLQVKELQVGSHPPPLASALAALPPDQAPHLHLAMVSGKGVREIAESIKRGLTIVPDAYGRPIADVHIVEPAEITEECVGELVRAFLTREVRPDHDRVMLTWGSGSTQVALGTLDAIVEYDAPWQVIPVKVPAGRSPMVFDPTRDLPVDPVVPLLRRWRYHDLLEELRRNGELRDLTPEQERLIEAEAAQWGRAYPEPTAPRLRAAMAAALMRGDASGGFAVRAYVTYRYRELLLPGEIDLINWAEHANSGKKKAGRPPTLGVVLERVREEQRDQRVREARDTSAAGRFLASKEVCELNRMGTDASHELQPPSAEGSEVLRDHLRAFELNDRPTADGAEGGVPGFSRVSLVPSTRVWYLGVLPLGQNSEHPALAQALETATAPVPGSDRVLRDYLGVADDQPLPVGLLAFGTKAAAAGTPAAGTPAEGSLLFDTSKGSEEAAVALAKEWHGRGYPAFAEAIDVRRVMSVDHGAATFERALREHVEQSDVAAFVIVPSAVKEPVMSLLIAAQRVAAEWGVPLYLRQLVDGGRSVSNASYHRLPLRFGTGLALLSAALHAFDSGEWGTAARLLGAASAGRELADRAMALSNLIRCDFRSRTRWPAEFACFAPDDLSLIADRVEVWARLANLPRDVPTQIRAIVGACAAAEVSATRRHWPGPGRPDPATKERIKADKKRVKGVLGELFRVRNALPVTHGAPLVGRTLDDLVADRTKGRFTSVSDLLAGMVQRASRHWPRQTDRVRPGIADLAAEVREELRRRYEAQRRGPSR